jgi:F-type H+-transporting ATPase subunit b
MENGFGLNTNIFETNLLNLTVVVGIVVTFVGDAFRRILDRRRRTILSALQDAEKTAAETQIRLDDAKKSVDRARVRAQEIRIQALRTIERENIVRQQQLEKDLQRLQEAGRQAIQLEYQRTVRSITQKVAKMVLAAAERTLRDIVGSTDQNYTKQTELNEVYVRYTLRQLREKLLSLPLFTEFTDYIICCFVIFSDIPSSYFVN